MGAVASGRETYVGQVEGGDARIGLVVADGAVVAYLARGGPAATRDQTAGTWLRGSLSAGALELHGEHGERLDGRVGRGSVTGTVALPEAGRGVRRSFTARAAAGGAHFIFVSDDGVYGRGRPLVASIQLDGESAPTPRRWGKLNPRNCDELLGGIKAMAIKINSTVQSGGTVDPSDEGILTILLNQYAKTCESQAPGVLV